MGDEILTVVDLDPVKVEVQVLEGEVGLLAEGRLARVTFAAFPGEAFTGRVQTINPLVERQTRTARVTVTSASTSSGPWNVPRGSRRHSRIRKPARAT